MKKQRNILDEIRNSKTFIESCKAFKDAKPAPVKIPKSVLYLECLAFSKIKHKEECTRWSKNRPDWQGEWTYSKCNCIPDYEERLEKLLKKIEADYHKKYNAEPHKDNCTIYSKNRSSSNQWISNSVCDCDRHRRLQKLYDIYLETRKLARGF